MTAGQQLAVRLLTLRDACKGLFEKHREDFEVWSIFTRSEYFPSSGAYDVLEVTYAENIKRKTLFTCSKYSGAQLLTSPKDILVYDQERAKHERTTALEFEGHHVPLSAQEQAVVFNTADYRRGLYRVLDYGDILSFVVRMPPPIAYCHEEHEHWTREYSFTPDERVTMHVGENLLLKRPLVRRDVQRLGSDLLQLEEWIERFGEVKVKN